MATLNEIKTEAEYQQKNFVQVKGIFTAVDYDKFTTTIGGKTFDLSLGMMSKVLDRIGVAGGVNFMANKYPKPESSLSPDLFKCQHCQQSKIKNRDTIIKDMIKFGLRHQKTKSYLIYDQNTNNVKGVVYNGYKFVSQMDVIEAATETYGNEIDERLSYINDTNMVLFFRSNEEQRTPIAKERILYGWNVRNSGTGDGSLGVDKGLTFLRCSNGLVLDEIKHKIRLRHVRDGLMELFQMALNKFLTDRTVLDLIDDWATKPAIWSHDTIITIDGFKKIDKLLSAYKVSKEDWRKDIYNRLITAQEEEHNYNAYWLGNAINDYASNVMTNAHEANNLLSVAYNVMNMV